MMCVYMLWEWGNARGGSGAGVRVCVGRGNGVVEGFVGEWRYGMGVDGRPHGAREVGVIEMRRGVGWLQGGKEIGWNDGGMRDEMRWRRRWR